MAWSSIPVFTIELTTYLLKQISMRARTHENNALVLGGTVNLVDKEKVPTYVTLAVRGPVSGKGMIKPFRWKRPGVFYQK